MNEYTKEKHVINVNDFISMRLKRADCPPDLGLSERHSSHHSDIGESDEIVFNVPTLKEFFNRTKPVLLTISGDKQTSSFAEAIVYPCNLIATVLGLGLIPSISSGIHSGKARAHVSW